MGSEGAGPLAFSLRLLGERRPHAVDSVGCRALRPEHRRADRQVTDAPDRLFVRFIFDGGVEVSWVQQDLWGAETTSYEPLVTVYGSEGHLVVTAQGRGFITAAGETRPLAASSVPTITSSIGSFLQAKATGVDPVMQECARLASLAAESYRRQTMIMAG